MYFLNKIEKYEDKKDAQSLKGFDSAEELKKVMFIDDLLNDEDWRLSPLKLAVIFLMFVVMAGLLFYQKRANVINSLESYNVQFSLADSLLKEFSHSCKVIEFGNYYTFQDHALTRYRIISENRVGFPFFVSDSYLDLEQEYRDSWQQWKNTIDGCEN